jgi:hypothetical protein
MRDPVGKVLAMCGVLVLALSITPTGGFIDPDDGWWVTQWTWIQRTLRQGPQATPVTINPLLLYLGMILSIGGIALRPSGSSTPYVNAPRPKEHSMNIFIGNLAFTTTEDDLRQLFATYGHVARVQILQDRATGRSRGFGFVEMSDTTEAQAAIDELHGRELGGRTLTVSEARPRRPRG